MLTPIPSYHLPTISAWVNPAVTTQGAYSRIAETMYNTGFYLGTDGSGTKYQWIVTSGAGATGSCGAAFVAPSEALSPPTGTVTGTYDGTTARLYVDSTLVGSDTMVSHPAPPIYRSPSAATSAAANRGTALSTNPGFTTAPSAPPKSPRSPQAPPDPAPRTYWRPMPLTQRI